MSNQVRVRKCSNPADAESIHFLVSQLATFEKKPKDMQLSVADFQRDGFQTNPPLFLAALAEEKEGESWKPVGLVLFFFTYSTWEGKAIRMEDLFVLPSHRRKGIATMLFNHCVAVAKEHGCKRIDWNVLDWNEGAKKFYHFLGAEIPDAGAWELMRFDSVTLENYVPKSK